jgi:hypothetical protein
LSERNDDDADVTAIELALARLHLAEVRLTRQSGQVPQKDEQKIVVNQLA